MPSTKMLEPSDNARPGAGPQLRSISSSQGWPRTWSSAEMRATTFASVPKRSALPVSTIVTQRVARRWRVTSIV